MSTPRDRGAVSLVEEHAFIQQAEVGLVDVLIAEGDVVVELVAEEDSDVVGHILLSRFYVQNGDKTVPAVALGPLAVELDLHGRGIGGALIRETHIRLKDAGETLAMMLGDPAYSSRFDYTHDRTAKFESDYQCDALQTLAWGDAPESGKLFYASPLGTALPA